MKKILSVLLALSLVLLCLTGCGSGASANTGEAATASSEVYELTLTMHDSQTSSQGVYLQSWADQIEKATNNHVKVTIYFGATLSAAADVADKVMAGAVDMGWLYTAYFAGQCPLTDVINLPMQGFGEPISTTKALWDIYEKYPEVQNEWSRFKLLMLYGNPGMILCSADKPLTSVEDVKGQTIRCTSGAITDVLTAWGASPVTIPTTDLYEALEKKNVTSYIFEPSGIKTWSLYELTRYYTDVELYDGPFAVIVNLDSWNKLPKEYQDIIEGLSGRNASIAAAEAFAADVEEGRKLITENGGEFLTMTDEEYAGFCVEADKYAEQWAAEQSKDGFDAAAYLSDAKAIVASYK